jgi:hypothetical protein
VHAMGSAARQRVEMNFVRRSVLARSRRSRRWLPPPSQHDGATSSSCRVGGDSRRRARRRRRSAYRNLFTHFDPTVHPRLLCIREPGPLADEFRAAGFSVEVVPRPGPKGIVRLPLLVAALRRHRVDAVLVSHHQRASLLFGPVAAKLARVPVTVVAPQDMDLAGLGKRVHRVGRPLCFGTFWCSLSPSQNRYHTQEGVGPHRWAASGRR